MTLFNICDARQFGARTERSLSDVGDTVGNRDAGKFTAILERILPDAGNSIWNVDTGDWLTLTKPQTARPQFNATISERHAPDACDR